MAENSKKRNLTRLTGLSGSWEYGTFWFRIFGYGLMLKAPWATKLFSERYGQRKFWPKDGWRIGALKP